MKQKLGHYVAFSILSLMLIGAFLYATKPVDKDDYMEITVSAGDTLWELAEKYRGSHNLSTHEFIEWVMDVNRLTNERIIAGEKIVIPVLKSEGEELVASNQ
ncbi:LysM domain-containing protein [Anoxybacillus vitaminiphilus]|uniref:LysM domain-containing protein n=1 Tax=Paranoxybacillus vitaminiphilus TaxID=581036 RepID=A0A327YUS7_9BACL|nr:cell division suppressor protein YneA [Anoxybacillus vitaminiphilus]RAK23485.1 LysM domain-containing protein [Anoxybacillus vitaminiphilus]